MRSSTRNSTGNSSHILPLASIPNSMSTKACNEEILKYQQDITLINQKIAEITGETFTSSVPLQTSLSLNDKENRYEIISRVLSRLADLDRAVLTKTAPHIDASAVAARRASRGNDLFSLPTHLHLIARLMDVYAQSKRVTITHSTKSSVTLPAIDKPITPSSGWGGKTGSSINGTFDQPLPVLVSSESSSQQSSTIARLTQQLKDVQEKHQNSLDENLIFKKQISDLRKELSSARDEHSLLLTDNKQQHALQVQQLNCQLENLTANNEHLRQEFTALKKSSSAAAGAATVGDDKKLQEQQAQLKSLASELSMLQINHAHVTATVAEKHKILLNLIKSVNVRVSVLNSQLPLLGISGSDDHSLTAEAVTALAQLDAAVNTRLDNQTQQIISLTSVKEALESENMTYSVERAMLSQDFSTLSAEHEALKGAYHALETEAMSFGRQPRIDINDPAALRGLDTADKITTLENESKKLRLRVRELERLAGTVLELEARVQILNDELRTNASNVLQLTEELKSYKKLTDTLKQKIKDLSTKDTNSSNREFLDSFEEVMREEMMTMKVAFENKLKAAREDADASSRRHLQEIHRMQQSSVKKLS